MPSVDIFTRFQNNSRRMKENRAIEVVGRLPANESGCLVTTKLEEAKTICRQKVQEIVDSCREANRCYRYAFPSIHTILRSSSGLQGIPTSISWRIENIVSMDFTLRVINPLLPMLYVPKKYLGLKASHRNCLWMEPTRAT